MPKSLSCTGLRAGQSGLTSGVINETASLGWEVFVPFLMRGNQLSTSIMRLRLCLIYAFVIAKAPLISALKETSFHLISVRIVLAKES